MHANHYVVLTAVLLLPAACRGQKAPAPETTRAVADAGISVPGWQGAVDGEAAKAGAGPAGARLAQEGEALHVSTGPAVTYWKASDTVSGDYTVRATFRESKYMNLNDHPHPYGLTIAGQDMGAAGRRYLYCAAYGNGRFIVRGFGPGPFQLNGRGEANAAVHRAASPGEPVEQEIALSVRGDRVQCAINGTVVGDYAKADVIGPGKLETTDGVYGIRFAHNTEALVTGLTVTRP